MQQDIKSLFKKLKGRNGAMPVIGDFREHHLEVWVLPPKEPTMEFKRSTLADPGSGTTRSEVWTLKNGEHSLFQRFGNYLVSCIISSQSLQIHHISVRTMCSHVAHSTGKWRLEASRKESVWNICLEFSTQMIPSCKLVTLTNRIQSSNPCQCMVYTAIYTSKKL